MCAGSLCAGVGFGPAPARADRLNRLLFEMGAQTEYAATLTRTVVRLEVRPKAGPAVDPASLPLIPAFGVAVVDGTRRLLLTAGPLMALASSVVVVAPSGRRVSVPQKQFLGTGEVCVLDTGDPFLEAELRYLPLDRVITLKRTTPLFALDGLGAPKPFLVKGVVVEVFDNIPALKGLFVTDLRFPHGTALFSAERTLLGLSFRPQAADGARAVAASAEILRAWIHPKGPTSPP